MIAEIVNSDSINPSAAVGSELFKNLFLFETPFQDLETGESIFSKSRGGWPFAFKS